MSTTTNILCAGCKNILPKKEFLTCTKCKSKYDIECSNISQKQFQLMDSLKKSNWMCPECLNKQPKTGNIHTPIRSATTLEDCDMSVVDTPSASYVSKRKKPCKSPQCSTSQYTVENVDLTERKLRDIIQQELALTIQNLVSAQLKTITDQITGFCDSINFINAQYEEMKVKLEEKSNLVDQLKSENEHLKSTVKDLSSRLNIVEVHMRENNIEINGIPENRAENLANLVVQLGRTVNHPLTAEDIHHATRVAQFNKNNEKPRAVVVKLQSARHRDAILAAVVQFNKKNPKEKLNSHHLGIGGTSKPIYVSEHLTPANKSLHAATRLKAKEKNYRFVWIRNGKIFVRKDEFTQAKLIRNEDSLKLIN